MTNYIGKYLFIEWDLHDASEVHYGWDRQFVQTNMGTYNYMCYSIKKNFNKMLNNETLMGYIKGLLYVEQVDILNEKDMEKRIKEYQKAYIKNPEEPWTFMIIRYLFEAMYSEYKDKLSNNEFNLLYLAAEECGYDEVFDGDDRIIEKEDGYYLRWPTGKMQKID